MKVLERNQYGRPRVVELTDDEQRASAKFDELLDEGKGVVEAAEIAVRWTNLHDAEFFDWLAY